jgi:hypothetical protein
VCVAERFNELQCGQNVLSADSLAGVGLGGVERDTEYEMFGFTEYVVLGNIPVSAVVEPGLEVLGEVDRVASTIKAIGL